MKIKNNKKFKLDNIPDLSSNINNKLNYTVNNTVDEIFNNYRIIAKDSKKTVEQSLEIKISKPLIMYNLMFMIEIYLKFYLLKFKSIRDVEKLKHNIYNLIEETKNMEKNDFEELVDLLKRIKNKNNRNVDYNNYYNFKYNHEIEQNDLIFNYECTEKDILSVKDVIEWMNSNFPIL